MTSSSQVYIGGLRNDVEPEELKYKFKRFGTITEFSFKGRYAFIDYEDPAAAKAAIKEMHDSRVNSVRIQVELAKTPPRSSDRRDRSPRNRGPSPSDKCFKCNQTGHWARDCPARRGRRDSRDRAQIEGRCFKCDERGHRARECRGKPRRRSRSGGSYDSRRSYRSGRSRDSYRRGGRDDRRGGERRNHRRSPSRSYSPVQRRGRDGQDERRGGGSPRQQRSRSPPARRDVSMSQKDDRRGGKSRSRSPQDRRRGGEQGSASSYRSRSVSRTSRRQRGSRSKSGEPNAASKGYERRSRSRSVARSDKRMNPEVENDDGARNGGGGAGNNDHAENGGAGGDGESKSQQPAAAEQNSANQD